MSSGSVILVGGPASGKTNYIARLWLALQARKGRLRADVLPENIEYVGQAVRHLNDRKFAPRSDKNMDEGGRRDFNIKVRLDGGDGRERDLTVPDITGELWSRAIKTYELPQEWVNALSSSSSAILFIRAHSKLNVQPMDWVTARDELLEHNEDDDDDTEDDDDNYGEDEDEDGEPIAKRGSSDQPVAADEPETVVVELPAENVEPAALDEAAGARNEADAAKWRSEIPAQVGFCELLRYLSLLLGDRPDGGRPRVAVVITAWDTLDAKAQAAGPMRYLEDQFPMFAGRIEAPDRLHIETFGLSIVGGNLRDKAFRETLAGRDLSQVGFTAVMRDGAVVQDEDVTLPLAWALGD